MCGAAGWSIWCLPRSERFEPHLGHAGSLGALDGHGEEEGSFQKGVQEKASESLF
jgi:hypothetical protein